MTQQESRLPTDAANSDITTAQEFNLGCAMNSQPFGFAWMNGRTARSSGSGNQSRPSERRSPTGPGSGKSCSP